MASALGLADHDRPDTQDPAPNNTVGMAVLVIDDDAEFLTTIRSLLMAHGFEVYTATSGPKGLNILVNAPENLRVLLLDYRMPGFDGAKTLQYVHQVRPKIKVIAVTAVGYDQLPAEFRDGVERVISKPFRTEDLVAAIEEIISGPTRAVEPVRSPAASP